MNYKDKVDKMSDWALFISELDDIVMFQAQDKIQATYVDVLKDIKKQVRKTVGGTHINDLTTSKVLETDHLVAIGNQIHDSLKGVPPKLTQTMQQASGIISQHHRYGAYAAIGDIYGLDMPITMLDEDVLKSLIMKPINGKNFSQRLYKNTNELANAVTQSIISGVIDGKGYGYIAKRVQDLTEANYKRALTIARTEAGRVASETQQITYDQIHQDTGIKMFKMWVATFDSVTRDTHQYMDGKMVPHDEHFTGPGGIDFGNGPRLTGMASEDINCRCTTVVVLDEPTAPVERLDNITKKMVKISNYKDWAAQNLPKPQAVIQQAILAKAVTLTKKKSKNPNTKITPPKTSKKVTRGHLDATNIYPGLSRQEVIMKELGVTPGMASHYEESVRSFSSQHYHSIRTYQKHHMRGMDPSLDSFFRANPLDLKIAAERAKYLEDYISKAPKWDGGELYRGVLMTQDMFDTLKVGSVIDQMGASSWSSAYSVADDFMRFRSGGVRVMFTLDKTDVGTSIKHLSKYSKEDEVLISALASQEIVEILQIGDYYKVIVREVWK